MSENTKFNFVEADAGAIYNDIIQSLEKNVNEPLYPGDERRIYGEAMVAVLVAMYSKMNDTARQSLLRYARGEVLDALGERTGTSRLASRRAVVTLRFYVTDPQSTNIIIPIGTKATPDGIAYFMTSTAGVIQAGQTSTDVSAIAEQAGTVYNGFAPDTIISLVDQIPYIERVTNITASRNGDDGEPYTEAGDNRYRERIRLSPGKLSTAGPANAYQYWAMTADSEICDVRALSPYPGEVLIVPLMNNGGIPDVETLSAILKVVSDDAIRPLTDRVFVQAPTVVEYDIDLKYYTYSINEAEVITNIEGDGGAIDRFNNWQMGQLGRDINPDYLRRLILAPDWEDNLAGAVRLDLVKPVFVEINETEVAKWSGKINVTHEVIAGGA